MGDVGRPVLVFDGDCGFCTTTARWAERGWTDGARAVPWQHLGEAGLAELGLTAEQARAAAWWVDRSNRRFRGHRAVGKALAAGKGWRRSAGALILIPPISWLAAPAYAVVTRYRYRLPGGTPACRVNQAEQPHS